MVFCRLVFIKGLTAAPTEPAALQHMSEYWLGCYGLLLPPSFFFMVGVATHPEAEAAQMQVGGHLAACDVNVLSQHTGAAADDVLPKELSVVE